MPTNQQKSSSPSAAGIEQPADANAMLVGFLQHRDVHCPRCDYNLRNATHPVCPECGEPLLLRVGLERAIIGALLATAAPALGCGVCSLIFGILIMAHPGAPPDVVLVTLLMFLSGIAAVAILVVRRRFLRQSRQRQWLWAGASVAIHLALIGYLVVNIN
jgi:hypothetical protein